jgi:hypothetical protein
MDLNTNAYRIVKGLTDGKGATKEEKKRKATSAAGHSGGRSRAERLTPERRREIALRGSEARWKRRNEG